MAASLHHQIRRGLEGSITRQSWEGLKDMLEDLKKLPLGHPDVYRNRTLNRNPSLMAAFLNLRSPSASLDSFSPEDLLGLQDVPGYGFELDELRSLPGLDPHHTLHSLGEMLEQLSICPSHHQTDQQKEILRLNPALKAALLNMKDLESGDSDSGSVDGDEVGESRARTLFLASVYGASQGLIIRAMNSELKEEKTNDKMVEFLEVFLGQGVSSGQFTLTSSLMKQLSLIDKTMFNSSLIEAFTLFLDQNFHEENMGKLLEVVMTELEDVKKDLCCLLVEIITSWVANAGLGSDTALQTKKPAAALRLLKRPDLRRDIEAAAPEGFNILYQSLKLALITPQPGLLSTTREVFLEMILLIKCPPPVQLSDPRSINEDSPDLLPDPVRKVPPRLITRSMVFSASDVQEESSEEETESQEEVRLMLPIHFELEEGEQVSDEESQASHLIFEGYDSDASVVVEFEKTIEED